MDLSLISEILGWSSVIIYISLTIFNTMKVTRYAAFLSGVNDVAWSALMGWWPKLILNMSVLGVNSYRYAKDFTKAPLLILNLLAALMIGGVLYIAYFAVSTFLAAPSLAVGMQFIDLFLIVTALYMQRLKHYRIFMLISGFVGMVAYFGNVQMMIIKALVISIMVFKLFIQKENSEERTAETQKEPVLQEA